MPNEGPKLSSAEITQLYGALRSELYNLPVQEIRNTAAAAGPCDIETRRDLLLCVPGSVGFRSRTGFLRITGQPRILTIREIDVLLMAII